MAKVSPLQSSFISGELSPLYQGQVTADRYKDGLKKCFNMIPCLQGGLTRRTGTYFVSEVKTSSKKTRLIPFEFSSTQAYMLEFGDQYIRFYMNNGLITLASVSITGATAANPVVITAVAHGYSNGDRVIIAGVLGMTELNNREFTVANVTANTFELSGVNGTTYTAYSSGGTVSKIYEISSPYLEADLFKLNFTQSADTMYIASEYYSARALTRTTHTSWTLDALTLLDGPYLNLNIHPFTRSFGTKTMTPSATSGAITMALSSGTGAAFVDGLVGRIMRIRDADDNWTYGTIGEGIGGTNGFDFTVVGPALKDLTAITEWRIGVWVAPTTEGSAGSLDGDTPNVVKFHEDRLTFGGSRSYPTRLDFSNSSDYLNFAPSEIDGTITDSNAIVYSLNSNGVNKIRWIESDEKGLLAGTQAGEWVVKPSNLGEGLTPTNISAKQATTWGSGTVRPVQVNKATLFIQKAGRKLREFTYFYDSDGFRSPDLTVLAEHISQSGIVDLAFQKEPQSIVWCVREDGVLAGMTYEREPDSLKVGWHRQVIGGTSDAAGNDAVVESVSVIPSADGTTEDLWLIVKRRIGGGTKRFVEYLSPRFEDTVDQKDGYFFDAGLSYDNPLTVSGATAANPVVLTVTGHGLANGDKVLVSDVSGMSELNGETYTVANKTANTFELLSTDGMGFGAYVSGGEVRKYVTQITGLYHLEGQTVSVIGDGAVQADQTVSHGKITLATRATTVHIGYDYNSDGQLLRVEAGAADGTSFAKTKRTHRVAFLVHRSAGFKIGYSFDDLIFLPTRDSSDAMGRAPALRSEIRSETVPCDYDFENELCFRASKGLPLTILAIAPQLVTQDRG
jgi:hypothetical protein